jgi:hypothetical protein
MRMLILVCFLVLCTYMQAKRSSEEFALASNEVFIRQNMGTSPWKRHSASIESVPVDTPIKYKYAYYYELTNKDYEDALQKAFANTCEGSKLAEDKDKWSKVVDYARDPNISAIYPLGIELIAKVLNSTNTLKLSNGSPYLLQIVHDVLLGAKKHVELSHTYILEVDTIIYREFAANAKHVQFVLFAQINASTNKWKIDVIEQYVKGIVTPESIQLFPTLKMDPVEMGQTELTFNPNPLVPFPTTLLDKDTIDFVVQQQYEKQKQSQASAI